MQYYYIVVYTIVGDDMTMCKIGLNPHQMIEWGRREATKHPERTYELFRQPITRTGTLSFYKQLPPFADGSKFGVEDNDLGVKITETYSVQIRKLRAVLPLVKTVKDALHISLKEAKDIVDKARTTNGRIDNLSKEAAEKMAANINYWKGEAIIIAKEQSL